MHLLSSAFNIMATKYNVLELVEVFYQDGYQEQAVRLNSRTDEIVSDPNQDNPNAKKWTSSRRTPSLPHTNTTGTTTTTTTTASTTRKDKMMRLFQSGRMKKLKKVDKDLFHEICETILLTVGALIVCFTCKE